MSARPRLLVSRILAGIVVLTCAVTTTPWLTSTVWVSAVESFSMLLLFTGVLLRLWSALFVSGKKEVELVDVGPYSICRNPLYVGSFLAIIGIALASKNVLVVLLVLLSFVAIYPAVIAREEKVLLERHSTLFRQYKERVPAFVPRPSLYTEPTSSQFEPRRLRRALGDLMVFPVAWGGIHLLADLVRGGVVPSVALGG